MVRQGLEGSERNERRRRRNYPGGCRQVGRGNAVKKTNPFMWGAVAAVIAAGLWFFNYLIGTPQSENTLLQNPITTAVVFFFWGCVAGYAKNWYGSRLNRR